MKPIDTRAHWSKDKLFGYNALFSAVVGARGLGKTFAMKHYGIKSYLQQGKPFAWVMRYSTELDTALAGNKFFMDIAGYFPECDLYVKGRDGYIDRGNGKELLCTFKAMSEVSTKAITLPNSSFVAFDEFIPKIGVPYLKDDVVLFLDLYYTISRGNDIRALLCANNVTAYSPYYTYFNVHLPPPGEILKVGEFAIENAKNDAFKAKVSSTRFGKLINGTNYYDYAVDNKNFDDADTNVVPRPNRAKCVASVRCGLDTLYLWSCRPASIWVSDRGGGGIEQWVLDGEASGTERKIDFTGSYALRIIKTHYRYGTIFFESAKAKSLFYSFFSKFLR